MQLSNPIVSLIIDVFVGKELEKQRTHAKRSLKSIMRLAENNRTRLGRDDIEKIVEFFDVNPMATLSFDVHREFQDGLDVKSSLRKAMGRHLKDI